MKTELATLFAEFRSRASAPLPQGFLAARPLFIYGAGGTGKAVHEVLVDAGYAPDCFLDAAAKPDASWLGIPVFRPDDPAITEAQRQTGRVIIGVFNTNSEVPPIIAKLRALGYGQIATFVDFHAAFSVALGDRYWLTARSFYLDHLERCIAVQELWSDQQSRALYEATLRFRLLGDYDAFPASTPTDQYFPDDLPGHRQPLRFVDCGAYRGDTLQQALSKNLVLQAVAAFEPDDCNFAALSAYTQEQRTALPKDVFLFPCGVDGATRKVGFVSGQGAASRVDRSGNTVVQCTSIDEAIPGFSPTLIKMDIEGAELAALHGARRTITEHRPALAICVYHRPAHLWQIPQLLANLYGDRATYHLRSHGWNGFDLVMYVRPR